MIPVVAFFLGAILGAVVAKKRGGNRLDMLQYAGVWGLLLALGTIIATVFSINMGWT